MFFLCLYLNAFIELAFLMASDVLFYIFWT